MKDWNSFKDFFSAINDKTEYIVLRNYEDYLEDRQTGMHPDIDVLCSNREAFLNIIESLPRTANPKDQIHRYIIVGGRKVDIDIRHVGDGYYDTNWEIELLKHRKLINGFIYVPDDENYYFSLLYHALIQKYKVSSDYQIKLRDKAVELGIDEDKAISLKTLQAFMREKKYFFTYPEFYGGITNFKMVDKSLIKRDLSRMISRIVNKAITKFKRTLQIKENTK